MRPLVVLPPLVFLALAAVFALGMNRPDADQLPSTLIGRPAPPVTERALAGHPPITPDLLTSGDLVLVNFWASWCPPCRAEHPTLTQLAGSGLTVVGVNFGDQEADALQFLADEGNPFAAIAHDPSRRTAVDWGVAAPPESFLVNGQGEVVFKFIGPLVGDDFRQRFLPALQAAEDAAG